MPYRTPYSPTPGRYSGIPPQTNHACPASACRHDPRSSAERARTFEEEAFLSDTPRMWDIFRPDARPTTFEEGIAVMRTSTRLSPTYEAVQAKADFLIAVTNQVNAINAHERFLAEQNRAMHACGQESVAWIAGGNVEAQLVELVHRAPDAEIRRACQAALRAYYKYRRDEEVRVAEALRIVERLEPI